MDGDGRRRATVVAYWKHLLLVLLPNGKQQILSHDLLTSFKTKNHETETIYVSKTLSSGPRTTAGLVIINIGFYQEKKTL